MPWKSDAQRKWSNSDAGRKALGGQAKVDEWNQATEGKSIPEKVMPTKKYPNLPKHIHRVTEKPHG